MPRDGNGTYSRAVTPPANGDVASATDFNSEMNDIASALTASINTAGTKAMAANLAMGGFKVTGLAAGTANGDALRYEQGYRVGGTDVALADGGTGASLADPNADRLMFWDDSAGAVDWLTPGTGLTITGTTIALSTGAAVANLGFTPLNPANNLSDLGSASTARSNLGLGTAATQNTGTSGANVPLLNAANTWSGKQSVNLSSSGAIVTGIEQENTAGGAGAGVAYDFKGVGTQSVHARIATFDAGSFNSDLIFSLKTSGMGSALAEAFRLTSAGEAIITTSTSTSARSVGFRGTNPLNIGGNTTLDGSHNGRKVFVTASCTITIPSGLPDGYAVAFTTYGGVTLTLSRGSGVEFYRADGSDATGNRTLSGARTMTIDKMPGADNFSVCGATG